MSEIRNGGCQCGAVRYTLAGEPRALIACHCADCQKQSGSAFGMTLVVARADLTITSGELRTYPSRGDSGGTKLCRFCGDCGTRIYNELEKLPETFNLKPGTLDDTSWLRPVAHVWLDRKQGWVPVPDGVRKFDRNPF